jgi:hypothetical protein
LEKEHIMAMSRDDIKAAYAYGEAIGATHMIIATDSFDYEDYPIYVQPGEKTREQVPTNGDKVQECYSFALGWESQAREWRAKHWD